MFFRTLPFPGAKGVEVAVRLLTELEGDGARREAIRICENNKVKLALDPDYFERVLQREIIALAYYDTDTLEDKVPEPFFSSQEEVSELDGATVTQLFGFYEEHLQEADPLLYLDEDDAREVAEMLEKGQSSKEMLSMYDARTLLTLALSLAALLQKSHKPKSTTS